MNAATDLPALTPGAAFGGGFYAGRFFLGHDAYALIVAPKAEGELGAQPWNKTLKTVKGALSYCDGLANTDAMAKAGSALAKQVRALQIGGFDDWYLMSRLEALIAFGELNGAKAFSAEAFERDWYWTSTQPAGTPEYAWMQDFGYGGQSYHRKDDDFRARAVRRLKI